ncbi:MAG TPA: hypothetical protein VJT31_28170 [Rugosimonospora sp.]|nr:hypothetical protein [Rugosimonospora sp.]
MTPDAAPIELTVTPDRAFVRAVRRSELRQGLRAAGTGILVAVLLILTSLGSTVADGPWWTVFGMLGLAGGVLMLVVVVAWPFQHKPREANLLSLPVRYTLGPDGPEWTTDGVTIRLAWSAMAGVRTERHAYVISRTDGGAPHLICRTTLTVLEEAQLHGYFAAHLGEKSTTTGA